MPNWAYTSYHCVGDKDQLRQLHDTMKELQSMPSPGLHNNGFGSTWLGNLVIKLGGDWEKVYCRGTWDSLQLNPDGTLSFSTETAWSELNETRHFIESKFSGIKLYYQTEEEGMGIFQTNDKPGAYFPDRYYLWVEDHDTEYYQGLPSLCADVEDITGIKNLTTLEECRNALEHYSDTHNGLCYTLEENQIVED